MQTRLFLQTGGRGKKKNKKNKNDGDLTSVGKQRTCQLRTPVVAFLLENAGNSSSAQSLLKYESDNCFVLLADEIFMPKDDCGTDDFDRELEEFKRFVF